jgi:hypothetical protein
VQDYNLYQVYNSQGLRLVEAAFDCLRDGKEWGEQREIQERAGREKGKLLKWSADNALRNFIAWIHPSDGVMILDGL